MHRPLAVRTATLGGLTAAMWGVHVLGRLGLGRFIGHGIVPRTIDGLQGIPVAPFLHADFPHLLSNTVPFLVLGVLILLGGIGELLFVTVVSIAVAGAGTWLFGAPDTEHMGASGVVFGFFGYLVCRAAFDRRSASIAIMLVVAFYYGASMMYALVPSAGISWTGHFFGFAGGYAAARLRHPRRRGEAAV